MKVPQALKDTMNVSCIPMFFCVEVSTSQNTCARIRERMADLRDFLTENGVMFAILVVVFVGVIAAWGFEIFTYSGDVDNIISEPIVLEKVFNEVFKLTMIIPNDTYALGEPIHFTLKLSNIGNESVVIYYAWMDLLRYRVINPSGDMIYHKTEARGEYVSMVIVPETLGPNMTHEKLFIWRQVYQNYYDGAVPIDENPITTPGDYTIIGQTYFYLKENGRLSRIVEAELQTQVRII